MPAGSQTPHHVDPGRCPAAGPPCHTPALAPHKQRGPQHPSCSPQKAITPMTRKETCSVCVPLPSYFYCDRPAPPPSSPPAPQGATSQGCRRSPPRPPPPGAGRQRRARASLEPLDCLLRLPTASVPGEVSKASDPRTGMRKASSKQSQLPAPAQGGRQGESSRPHGTARHGTARHGTARHGCVHADARPRCVLPRWAAARLGRDESGPLALSCLQHRRPSQQAPRPPCPPPRLPPSLFFWQPPDTVLSCMGAVPEGCFTPCPTARCASSVANGPLGQGTAQWQRQAPTLASATIPRCPEGSQLVTAGTGMAKPVLGGMAGSQAALCPASVQSPRAQARARGCLGLSQPGEQVNLGLPDTWNKIAIP
ncbi:proline-rich protein 18-like isoform X1 [Falco cherrug]|uniref:proline-rich protein 18-like isoform X1 n=1 Tax=Falco cherrug TaxID=345164 RepID=UPI00247AB379|nr:proline-rich protein 18-like isoform X1 [Falco cherrug]